MPTAGDFREPTAAPGSGRPAVGLRVPNRLPNGKPVRFANAGRDADADGGLTLGTVTLGGRGGALLRLIAWMATVLAGQVTPYPLPVGDTPSSVYRVKVNGTDVPVSNSRDASYAHFAFSGTARVAVTVSQAVKSYRLSPAPADLAPTVRGSTIEWTMTRPRKLILHHVNELDEKLCILADPPEEDPPRPGDPGVVVLSGVDATGATDVTVRSRGVIDGRGYALRKAVNGREEGRSLISVAHGGSSSRVTLRDVIIRNPPVYSCIVFDTVDGRFSNVKFITDSDYANRDGIAPHNARRLIVDDCFFLTSDDCIAYSTTRPGLDLEAVVKNCVLYNTVSGAFIRHGPWIGDGTRGFTAENIDMIQGCEKAGNEAGIAFYAGGALRDIRYRNIRVENPRGRLIYMVTDWKDHDAGPRRGSISGVVFERLTCEGKGLIHLKAAGPSESIGPVAFMDFTYRGKGVLRPEDCDFAASGEVRGITFVAGSSPVVSLSASSPEVEDRSSAELRVTRSTAGRSSPSATTTSPGSAAARARRSGRCGFPCRPASRASRPRSSSTGRGC